MKSIEKKISTFIEGQFPAFYKEEGPQFISFLKSYFEWMEESGNPIGESRSLTEYKDIDTTLEEFILHFKEKYLKNIQFDTATNKVLLVKNALNLYRSKGTERSVDLFFKLVYGVPAEIQYPGERILRASNGIWEKPEYLEVSHSRHNINYTNRQIVGSKSGAKAFVEKYIRRKTDVGYVDLLYVSVINGKFINNEILGININNKPTFSPTNAMLIGSVKRIEVMDGGISFKVGDIVSLESTNRGVGGLARVAEVQNATGVVDFMLLESGFGYTSNSYSIISEKVLGLTSVSSTSNSYYGIFDTVYQPLINVDFTTATSQITLGDSVIKYEAGVPVAKGIIIDVDQGGDTGKATIKHIEGAFTSNTTYYNQSNGISFHTTSQEDRTITGLVMGVSNEYTMQISNIVGDLVLGDLIHQSDINGYKAQAKVINIQGDMLTVSNIVGAFNDDNPVNVVGSATVFNIVNIQLNIGVVDIKKNVNYINIVGANNTGFNNTGYIYQYTSNGSIKSKSKVITSNGIGNTAQLSIIPLSGYIEDTGIIFNEGNTAQAYVSDQTALVTGGDFIPPIGSEGTCLFSRNLTESRIVTISSGSGAQFNVGSLGDQETIFIGTDVLNSNNQSTLDYTRKIVSVTSNTGFSFGDIVYQKNNQETFDPTTINATTGFIPIASANSIYSVGDIVKYGVDSGNTVIETLHADDAYFIYQANSTGVILSRSYNIDIPINSTSYSEFLDGAVSETGHSLYVEGAGSIYSISGNDLYVKNIYNSFEVGGDNLSIYTNPSVNSAITSVVDAPSAMLSNSHYMSLPLRASAYGFPKNPYGNIEDSIYSCLMFDSFTIGSVGSLARIDPGFGYNVDPFVLIYQTHIAGFGRHDFLIETQEQTRSYITGELVNQTSANLINYDLTVAGSVFGNTYNEISILPNPAVDIDGATDFIYSRSLSVALNSGNIANTENFIEIQGNALVDNDVVRYYTDASNTAITGLANNSLYFVTQANSTGIKLSNTPSGIDVDIEGSSTPETGHNLVKYSNSLQNDIELHYNVPMGNTAITGLANNNNYFVVSANNIGFKLSATRGGAEIDISSGLDQTHLFTTIGGYSPNDLVYQIKNTTFNASAITANTITIDSGIFNLNDKVTYFTNTGNTAISGLANNGQYFVSSVSGLDIKLSATQGGPDLAIVAGLSETGHNLTANTTATIRSVYVDGPDSVVRVKDIQGTFATGFDLESVTNSNLNEEVLNIDLISITSTARGQVISSNSSMVHVKRLTFENTFREGEALLGESSGANNLIISISENKLTLPIGMNANVSANVITANGQVTQLQVIDSGYGYSNSEIVQYTSEDGLRSGSSKIIIDGEGMSRGYYRSSKGFLSADMSIHDGDYYQEYSYEVLSKISFDRYTDMFKKVMHMAGTKVFGSVAITDEKSIEPYVSETAFSQSVSFNPQLDIVDNSIEIDIPEHSRQFNATHDVDTTEDFISLPLVPFANGDFVNYYTSLGNTAIIGMANNANYYVVEANTSGIKISDTLNGPAKDIATTAILEYGHFLTNYINPFEDGDVVSYHTDAGNTVISGLSNNGLYTIGNTTPKTVKLYTGNTMINITSSGTSEIGHYLTKTIEDSL